MPLLTLKVNLGGLEHKMEVGIERASDLTRAMTQFGRHLKARALARYAQGSFEPLARGTMEKRAQKGINRLETKLTRDVRKAMQRQTGGAVLPKGILARTMASMAAQPGGALLASTNTRGVANRLSVLSEFQARHRKGSSKLMAHGGKPLSIKQLSSLDQREARAVGKAVGKKILGHLPDTVVVEIGLGTVTLASRAKKIPSAIHNDGGIAGHGSKIPKRETIMWDESDLDVLEALLNQHLLEAFEE